MANLGTSESQCNYLTRVAYTFLAWTLITRGNTGATLLDKGQLAEGEHVSNLKVDERESVVRLSV
jgi:hypothetical protein